jgi:hypothetical protein
MRNIILLMHSLRFGTNNCNKIDKLQFAVAETITDEVVAICMHWFSTLVATSSGHLFGINSSQSGGAQSDIALPSGQLKNR